VKALTQICFGSEPLGGVDWGDINIGDMQRAIDVALDVGVNFFDTAGVYGLGLSEERLSKMLGSRRHNVVIATKGGLSWTAGNLARVSVRRDSSASAIRNDVESSLRRLRLECLPIFYVHWPDETVPLSETFGELEKMCAEGKIESVGCSNFSARQMEDTLLISKIKYAQLPINILGGSLDGKVVELCAKHKVGIVAYNVLANGLLSGKYNKDSIFPSNDRRSNLPLFRGSMYQNALERIDEFKVMASCQKMSVAKYAIKWTLSQPNVVSAIVGIKNPQQMLDNWSSIT
jgi:aryl-alcohol dehydrogenase-like predicted oxidoreductase